MNRHEFLQRMAGASVAALLPQLAFGQLAKKDEPAQARLAIETCVYKTAQGCEIKADVQGAVPGARKPAVLWIHGGALIRGVRALQGAPVVPELLERGFVVVSIDYRLAPETQLPGIIEDLRDAWRWVRHEGTKRFGIDPDRIATMGALAGGYLTLMTGFCLESRPRALVSYYGYGDITSPWYSQPDAFYRRSPLVSKQEAYDGVGKRVLSADAGSSGRGRFYLYCRQNGIWPNEVTGHDPHAEPKWFDPYCPIRNVTAEYPPTLLIHGTDDTDVPYAESKNMAAKLAAVGVKHEFITVAGAGHGLAGRKPDKVAQIARQAAEFIATHTR